MEYTGTDRFNSLNILITNYWLRKSLYCRLISEWNSKIIINVTDRGKWTLACGVNGVWSVEKVGVCGEKLSVVSAREKWAFNFSYLCWVKTRVTPTNELFDNLCLVMFAFTFCLESKNKHLLDKIQLDIVTWYYAYHLLHSAYVFRHYDLTCSGSWHHNFFRNVKDGVHKFQNIAFVGVTWVFHFILKNRIDM
jgi:hypothetical protein